MSFQATSLTDAKGFVASNYVRMKRLKVKLILVQAKGRISVQVFMEPSESVKLSEASKVK